MTTQTHTKTATLTAKTEQSHIKNVLLSEKAEAYIKEFNLKDLTETNKIYLKLAFMRGYNTALDEITTINNKGEQ